MGEIIRLEDVSWLFYCERYVCLESVDSIREGSCESQGSMNISGTYSFIHILECNNMLLITTYVFYLKNAKLLQEVKLTASIFVVHLRVVHA